MTMKKEEYINVKELSQRIKMAQGTIRNMVCRGDFKLNIHYVKPTPRKVLFIWSAIEAWLYRTTNSPTQNQSTDQNQKVGLINI